MEEKGAQPPSYPVVVQNTEEKKKAQKWVFGLLFYAGAVTAALVTVAVLGSIYLNKVEQNCSQQVTAPSDVATNNQNSANTKKYMYEDEEFEVDEEADKEIIKLTGDHYGTGSMVVHDFKKGITGVYNARADECYLIGGIDEHIPSAREISRQFQEKPSSSNVTVHYGRTTDRPVTDLSLLPRELHDVCWGKNVYWLERMTEQSPDHQSSRVKRFSCPSGDVKVRYNGCHWFCCDFCIVYTNGAANCYTCVYKGYNCNAEPQ